jgi:hypothetical protein
MQQEIHHRDSRSFASCDRGIRISLYSTEAQRKAKENRFIIRVRKLRNDSPQRREGAELLMDLNQRNPKRGELRNGILLINSKTKINSL